MLVLYPLYQLFNQKETAPLPLVLIAHRDPELNINPRLVSIISMRQVQDVRVNIKFVGCEVHSLGTDGSWTGSTGR